MAEPKVSWDRARDLCRQAHHSADLAVVDTEDMMQTITHLPKNAIPTNTLSFVIGKWVYS